MVKIYTAPSCLGCRKVIRYFKEHHIEYVEKSIINTHLSKEDIFKMLASSQNGFDDIISTRSKAFKDKNVKLEDMKLSELVEFIINNPTVLKRPIILSDYELQVGFNPDDISLFLPEELRDMNCSIEEDGHCKNNEEDCEYLKNLKFDN